MWSAEEERERELVTASKYSVGGTEIHQNNFLKMAVKCNHLRHCLLLRQTERSRI